MDIILIFVFLYLICGVYIVLLDIPLPKLYIGLLCFLTFKWIFNYRKCTISRVECILRGVVKDEGYIYRNLNKIVDIRYKEEIYIIISISLLLILYNMIYKKQLFIYINEINLKFNTGQQHDK